MNRKPTIDPDYAGVTIPPNIAPMNFLIKEDGDFFRITVTSSSNDTQLSITSSDGKVLFPENSWKELLDVSKDNKIKIQVTSEEEDGDTLKKYLPIYMDVANEPIDSYLTYRLFYPGYLIWSKMKIVQRSLESFNENLLIENQLLGKSCINCHSFYQNNPDRFLLHIRGSKSGTYFVEKDKITRKALKTRHMPANATYPSWHPNGRYVAFSSNRVKQSFYAHPKKKIEAFDQVSSIFLYDRDNNEMFSLREQDTVEYLQTYPAWSPDGKYLYYCRTRQPKDKKAFNLKNIKNIHYELVRKVFDVESRTFGKTEIIFNAPKISKSASLPKISPNAQYLVFSLQEYGTFPLRHKESDLYLLELQNAKYKKMNLNSDETESYHTWSSNGKWLVFSSKRRDGRTARPYFAYFGSPDNIGKPFVLPQEDPNLYNIMLKTFNIPEFVTGRINIGPRDFAFAAQKEPIKAKPGNSLDTLSKCIDSTTNEGHVEM